MFDLTNNSYSVDPDYNHFQYNPLDFKSFSVDTFKEFSSNTVFPKNLGASAF